MYKTQCLKDIIAVRGICTTDGSNLWINDLPGIQAQKFELLTTGDDGDAKALWEKIERESLNSFYHNVIAALSSRFKMKTLQRKSSTGTWEQPFKAIPVSNNLIGTVIDLRGSDYMQTSVHSARIYIGNAPIISPTIFVYDLETGEQIDSISSDDANANGFYTIPINRSYQGQRLFIGYYGDVIESRKATFNTPFFESCETCYSCANCAQVEQGQPVIWDNINTNCDSGIIVSYSVECSAEKWICENAYYLATPLLYHVAKRFFLEVLASDRINKATLMPSEEFEKLVSYCEDEYQTAMTAFIEGIHEEDRVCFICNAPVKVRVSIP